ncbi:nucleoside deaminase [Paenibacillus monticola]|nr:nucleoside deaminase [Paenibacillus monticola]
MDITIDDIKFIRLVYQLAAESASLNYDPFAAILVQNNELKYKSLDVSVVKSNPTLHAEVNVIGEYCSNNKIFSLEGYTLYSSTEPCIMCSGAIHWSRISRVVYGVSQEKLKAVSKGNQKPTCKDLLFGSGRTQVIGPVLEEEGMEIFQRYPLIPKQERHKQIFLDQ